MSAEEEAARWVARAEGLAESKDHAVTNEAHLLRALLESERIRGVLARCELDTGRFVALVEALVDAQPRRSWIRSGRATLTTRVHLVTAVHADSAETELIEEILFVRALESKTCATLLEKLVEETAFTHVWGDDDCTDEDALHARSLPLRVKLVASHGTWREPRLVATAGAATVVVHDDPFTTMEFVTQILHEVFELPDDAARSTMQHVHDHGTARLLALVPSTALARVRTATSLARANGFPLRFTIERE